MAAAPTQSHLRLEPSQYDCKIKLGRGNIDAGCLDTSVIAAELSIVALRAGIGVVGRAIAGDYRWHFSQVSASQAERLIGTTLAGASGRVGFDSAGR